MGRDQMPQYLREEPIKSYAAVNGCIFAYFIEHPVIKSETFSTQQPKHLKIILVLFHVFKKIEIRCLKLINAEISVVIKLNYITEDNLIFNVYCIYDCTY